MTIVLVPVREQDVHDVLDWLRSRASSGVVREPELDVAERYVERPEVDPRPLEPATDREVIARVWDRVTDPARAVLKALAEHAPGEYGLDELQEAARVPNAGAAMQSIAIQLQKEPTMPVLKKLLKMRRQNGKYRYALSAERAQIVLEFAS